MGLAPVIANRINEINRIDSHAAPDSIKTWNPNQKSISPNINELLIKLNRLGLWIRSLSKPDTKKRRARAIAESQNVDLVGFQHLSYTCLEDIYPNCAETLREQLANSMTDRYAQLWYESYRVGAVSKSTPLPTTPTVDKSESSRPPGEDKLPEIETKPSAVINSTKRVSFKPSLTASIIDQTKKPPKFNSQAPPQSRPTQTESAVDSNLAEPPVPTFEKGKDCAKCEWCSAMLDNTMFRKKHGRRTWSQKGRYVL